jgi:hypothetical protein
MSKKTTKTKGGRLRSGARARLPVQEDGTRQVRRREGVLEPFGNPFAQRPRVRGLWPLVGHRVHLNEMDAPRANVGEVRGSWARFPAFPGRTTVLIRSCPRRGAGCLSVSSEAAVQSGQMKDGSAFRLLGHESSQDARQQSLH